MLTFASAYVANEWWLLVEKNFPDSSRPGPQLFQFKTDDLLAKAWRHPSFAHLKSKWMYISFSDAGDGFGGAAQGIIPVQDADGNMLGGSAPASPLAKEMKRETREVKNEVVKLEEHFEKMMAAVERNTEKVAELAEKDKTQRSMSDVVSFRVDSEDGGSTRDSVDMGILSGVLSGHLVRMNELLGKNSQHMEDLTRKHYEHEQRLEKAIDGLGNGRRDDSLDLQRERDMGMLSGVLSGHLVRMNELMGQNSQHMENLTKKHYEHEQRLEKAIESMNNGAPREPGLDMEQLSSHLDRIQSLMEASARERKDSTRDSPQEPLQVDFSPLTARLEKVQQAVETNSELIRALLNEGESKPETPFWGKEQAMQPDFGPLMQRLKNIHEAIEQQSEHMKALVSFAGGEQGTEGDANWVQSSVSLAPLSEHLEQIYNAIEEGNKHAKESRSVDLSPLTQHLEGLREHSEKQTDHLEQLVASQSEVREAVEANGGEIDFTPLAELLDAIRESTESNAEVVKKLLESQEATRKETTVDLTPLKAPLEAIRSATEKNAEHMQNMIQSQQTSAQKEKSPELDFSPMTDRLTRIQTILQKQADKGQNTGTGDAKFIMNALTSHLSRIQGVTDQNAQHVKSLREKHSAVQDKMHIAVAETSAQVRALVNRNEANEARIEVQNSQMRELMAGQREMVDVLRQLGKSIVAQNKNACDHIVVPPPRKMGKKVVGFVYDAKEGGV